MSQRYEKNGAAVPSLSEVQRSMREALQHEKAELIQDTLTTSTAVLQLRGAELLPLVLELCDPASSTSSKLKKFGFLNAAWKLLLTIMTSEHIDLAAFQYGATAMTQHLRAGVLSHDWTDAKKNKLAAFFASHVVTTVRAHPEFVLASPLLLEALTTLYYAVCVVLAMSDRDDTSLSPLDDHIMTRLHAVFECLGSTAAADWSSHPERMLDDELPAAMDGPGASAADGVDDADGADGGATTEAECPARAGPTAWIGLLRTCVSGDIREAVTAEAGGGPAVEAATSLAAASAFLHVTHALLQRTTSQPTVTTTTDVRGRLLAQIASLLLAWLPGAERANGQEDAKAASSLGLDALHARVHELTPSLPPHLLIAPRETDAAPGELTGSDNADTSSPRRLWRTCFATVLHALFHALHVAPTEACAPSHDVSCESDDWLIHVLLDALHLANADAAATVLTAWTDFVCLEEAAQHRLACAAAAADDSNKCDPSWNTNEEEAAADHLHTVVTKANRPLATLVHDTRCFSQLLCRLLCLAEGLLRVRARALEDTAPTAHNVHSARTRASVAAWSLQVSTALCTLAASGCTSLILQQPPSALLALATTGTIDHLTEEPVWLCQAAHLADVVYEGLASTMESTAGAVPADVWASVATTAATTGTSAWLLSLTSTASSSTVMSGRTLYAIPADLVWAQLQAAIQQVVQTDSSHTAQTASGLLSIPALLRYYRGAVIAQTDSHSARVTRLHTDLISSGAAWRRLTERLQSGSGTSGALASACRCVAALLLREFAFLPITLVHTEPHHPSRAEEVLMVCVRRWLQLAIPDTATDEAVDEESPARHSAAALDVMALEAAHSLLCFAEHNTNVSLHDLRLSETASAALMQLLSADEPAAPCMVSDSAQAAWLFPRGAANVNGPQAWLAPAAWDATVLQTLARVSPPPRPTTATRPDSPGADDEEAAVTTRHNVDALVGGADRYDALMAELQHCRQTIAAFLSAQRPHAEADPSTRPAPATGTDRARSPLPTQRSFGDALPHHLRGRRGRHGEGHSPSCSQTPPGPVEGVRCDSQPPVPPPPSTTSTPPPLTAQPSVPAFACLATQLQSVVSLSTQALEAMAPHLPPSNRRALDERRTTPTAAELAVQNSLQDHHDDHAASSANLEHVERTNGTGPQRALSTQPPAPASPWESRAAQEYIKTERPDFFSAARTRTVPIMTLSSRSSPQTSAQLDDPEVIDVDM